MKDPGSYANPINSSFQKFRTTRVVGRISPALAPRRVVVEGDLDAVGVVASSIHWVLLA